MKTLKSKFFIIAFFVFFTLVFSSCAKVVPVEECLEGDPYGFWNGLWHGIIAPFTFIIGLFKEEVAMYAINNNGGWYDFGFVLGASIIFGGGSKATCSKS